ncbi:DNA methylase [Subtercola sp. Z020]|uniref:DNA methylase n=1 Tax=Subtercola sp. Z020 TaxID=2080582 RepID=UPI000CE8897B|nr:DNA methylase [Subtercola sp. Z020]PPF87859.1 DNA methylase [Subtercola sp. Z020]
MANMNADDLGLDPASGRADQLYGWFLASLLFGRPVQQSVAADTWRVLMKHGLTSPGRFEEFDREGLRALLDEGHYARIDYVMTDELHDVMATVKREHGSVSELVKNASSKKELTDELLALKGIGPKTVEIFLREVPDALIGSGRG